MIFNLHLITCRQSIIAIIYSIHNHVIQIHNILHFFLVMERGGAGEGRMCLGSKFPIDIKTTSFFSSFHH